MFHLMPKTLVGKIIVFVVGVLIIILGLMTLLNSAAQSRFLENEEREVARLVNSVVLNGVRESMEVGDQEAIGRAFINIGKQEGIAEVFLADHTQTIKRCNLTSCVGKKVPLKELGVDETTLTSERDQVFISSTDTEDKNVFTAITPVPNETKCHNCHDASVKILGYFGLMRDWTKAKQSMGRMRNNSLVVACVAIVLVSLSVFGLIRRQLLRPMRLLITAIEPAAQGDLSQRVAITSEDEFALLGKAFNAIVANLHDMVGKIRSLSGKVAAFAQEISTSSREMNGATQEISSTVQKISRGVMTQAKSIENTSKLMEDMSSSVKQVAGNAATAAKSSEQSVDQAENGGKSIGEAVQKMNRITETVSNAAVVVQALGEKSKQIGQITETITNIADQTNLLALNAAIEAARAGDAGRGFAVVAEEVRKLAEGSAEAARRIGALIKGIQEETPKAVKSIQAGTKEVTEGAQIVSRVSDALGQIINTAQRSANMVNEITTATQAQLSYTDNITKAIEEVASVAHESASATEQASSSAEEQTASMQELTASAEELARLASELQNLVNKFQLSNEKKV